MKTLTTILVAAVILTSCTKKTTYTYKSAFIAVGESSEPNCKFYTKKEIQEKDAKLFKTNENDLF